jgi:N-sulfoglucosamine sulfohydrolase
MQRREFLRLSLLSSLGGCLALRGQAAPKPNVLFITVDDMNCDSVGAFGCKVPGTTPHLDGLAGEGIRFTHAHVQVANCVPSRNVMQTGRYPHNSRVEGFYQVKPDYPILPEVLQKNGYFAAIKGKVSHSTPFHPYDWDLVLQADRQKDRNAEEFHTLTAHAIAASQDAGKPFYLLMNITDPHKPFYGLTNQGKEIDDPNVPTRIYSPDQIVVPGFLPDFPEVRKELAHYYSSVRRADDCAGQVLRALRESGQAANTVVMFLSDHGMPFPFAKTSLYHHSTHTPWIVRWPGVTKPNSVDDQHMISAVDFMPTILDIAGIDSPAGLDGRSFKPLLQGQPQDGRDLVFKEYNENAGWGRNPMRSVCTRTYGYIFNPWANGTRTFKTATTGTATYRAMKNAAKTDPQMAARVELFDHRVREEFYDYEKDPDALHNLIDSPAHQAEINRLRKALEDWMVRTGDHALEAFRNRDNDDAVEAYAKQVQDEADARKRDPEMRRGHSPAAGRRTGLVSIRVPKSLSRDTPLTVTIPHQLPPALGEQPVHVTLKDATGKKRLARQVLKIRGKGELKVTFDLPADYLGKAVVFAVFVGKDYPSCLQHMLSEPIPLR